MVARKTTEQFIEKAKEIHGNKYNYDKVNYKTNKTKIEIICKFHGIFKQTPIKHLYGHGCIKCSNLKRTLNISEFIEKAKLIHKDSYDYSKTDYKNTKIKVEIICKKHGTFFQTPEQHLIGKGCLKCGHEASNLKRLSNTLEFIKKAKEIHGDKYDYSEANYISAKEKIKIICPIHNIFEQIPAGHLSGKGCVKCGGRLKLTTQEFIEKALIIHKNKYDYSKVNYKNAHTKIKIICKKHGIFTQAPNHHLNGNGCSKCSKNISKPEVAWLDSLNIPKEFRGHSFKINGRLFKPDAVDFENKIIWEFYGDFWHGNPEIYKPENINRSNHRTYGELYQKTLEKEQFLKEAGYKLITIWESDFMNSF